ncbi:cell wall mannoprotein 1 family protein [Aspergillus undulatus]|uniref:cell wall mannoprotein 1 family protein n=1 Tax=Aspergillus undulatus TaxID=1810928 RepID=UPI003CCCA5CE
MKLTTAITTISLLAPTALAIPSNESYTHAHAERDIATVKGVLTKIDTQVNSLSDAISAKPLNADAILKQADTLASTITDGTSTVNGQDTLNQLDALSLVSPTQKLADDTDSTVQSLIGIKSDVLKLGKGCTSLRSLEKLHDGATELSGAIVAKVPEALGDIAKGLSDKISAAIQKGADAFQGTCTKSAEAAPVKEDFPTPKMPVPVNPTPKAACSAPK